MKSKKIENQLLKNFRDKMFDTTYEEVAKATGLHPLTIGNAMRTGLATQKTLEALKNHFYPPVEEVKA